MNLYENETYKADVRRVAKMDFPWGELAGKSVLISGVAGLLGSFLTDVLLYNNEERNLQIIIYGLGRNEKSAEERFGQYFNCLRFLPCDVNTFSGEHINEDVEVVFHLASNTHPAVYASDPIGTIKTNVMGHFNLLDFAVSHGVSRYVYASSCEVYGENRGDCEFFAEDYCGYIDSNTLRAGYPESKRCGEALCQAYMKEKGLSVFIPRLSRTYGPTMLMSDSKALSQFIKKSLSGEDIVLKSDGMQYYSYTYMADAVAGMLTVLFRGTPGKAYNVADASSDIRLKDLAGIIAQKAGRKIVFELPEETEQLGYSKATKSRLDGTALRALGWRPQENIESGISKTLDILKLCQKEAEKC